MKACEHVNDILAQVRMVRIGVTSQQATHNHDHGSQPTYNPISNIATPTARQLKSVTHLRIFREGYSYKPLPDLILHRHSLRLYTLTGSILLLDIINVTFHDFANFAVFLRSFPILEVLRMSRLEFLRLEHYPERVSRIEAGNHKNTFLRRLHQLEVILSSIL